MKTKLSPDYADSFVDVADDSPRRHLHTALFRQDARNSQSALWQLGQTAIAEGDVGGHPPREFARNRAWHKPESSTSRLRR